MKKNPPWIACDSSNLHSYRWNPNSPFPLQVRFKDRKTGGVASAGGYAAPKEKYDGLVDSPSKGVYHSAELKNGGYSYQPLTGTGAE